MNRSFERTLGWIAFVAGAIWLILGLWEVFGPSTSKESNIFMNIMIPVFAMSFAYILLIRKK